MEFVKSLLGPDEGIVGSTTGIRCLLVPVRYYLNLGLPTKAWVIFRRVLTFGQLLGDFQTQLNDKPNSERKSLLLQLWSLDKNIFLSFSGSLPP